jgi:DNA-binding transcriptional regulator YhcF (GntR family)
MAIEFLRRSLLLIYLQQSINLTDMIIVYTAFLSLHLVLYGICTFNPIPAFFEARYSTSLFSLNLLCAHVNGDREPSDPVHLPDSLAFLPVFFGSIHVVPRTRSEHVQSVKKKLLTMIRTGSSRPGHQFLSNRAIAERFHISYQTADRLVRELVSEGLLERRPASGTFYPGGQQHPMDVLLIFNPRAKRKTSFGAHILEELIGQLDREGICWRMSWTGEPGSRTQGLPKGRYPVIWERPEAVDRAVQMGRHALLLNYRPPPGMASALIDSISVDDFSGGASAAQYLLREHPQARRIAVLGGPPADLRSTARINGFLSIVSASVFPSPTWYYESAITLADKVLSAGKDGIFCCADRLAEAVVRCCIKKGIKRPPLVSFDDAPIAQWLNLTTMAIPWTEMVSAAVRVIKQRQFDTSSSAIAQLVSTRLVIRS